MIELENGLKKYKLSELCNLEDIKLHGIFYIQNILMQKSAYWLYKQNEFYEIQTAYDVVVQLNSDYMNNRVDLHNVYLYEITSEYIERIKNNTIVRRSFKSKLQEIL